jgi:hypothetical protein
MDEHDDPVTDRPSDEAWTAPPRRRGRTAVASAVAMTLLGGSGWLASGHLLERQARQRVADRYEALRICLVGETGRLPPSEQLRLARLAVEHSPEGVSWPSRCLPYAAAFDEALEARAVPAELRALPRATAIVEAPDLHGHELDEIAVAIERADLPLPGHDPAVEVAPAATPARLSAHRLEPFASAEQLEGVVAAFDPGAPPGGRAALRLVVPDGEGLRICRLDGDLRDIRCRAVPLEPPPGAKLDLAAGPEGAGDLVQLRDAGEADGFYDAATGLSVWRSAHFDTQAVVSASGRITLSSGILRDGAPGERLERHQLVRIAPGQRPRASRLDVPPVARTMLLPDVLLHWQDGDRTASLHARRFDEQKVEAATSVGELPTGSRRVAHCRDAGRDAILFAAGVHDRRYTLLTRTKERFATIPVGVIAGRVALSCHGEEAMIERTREGVATRWRCGERCVQETTGAIVGLRAPIADFASLGARSLLLWGQEGGALRMRIGAPGELADRRDVLLIDAAGRSDLRLASLRLISGGGVALAILQDAALKLYALRIDERGEVTPVRPAL